MNQEIQALQLQWKETLEKIGKVQEKLDNIQKDILSLIQLPGSQGPQTQTLLKDIQSQINLFPKNLQSSSIPIVFSDEQKCTSSEPKFPPLQYKGLKKPDVKQITSGIKEVQKQPPLIKSTSPKRRSSLNIDDCQLAGSEKQSQPKWDSFNRFLKDQVQVKQASVTLQKVQKNAIQLAATSLIINNKVKQILQSEQERINQNKKSQGKLSQTTDQLSLTSNGKSENRKQQEPIDTNTISPLTQLMTYFNQRIHPIKFVGRGKYSDVYEAYDSHLNMIVVVKIFQKSIIKSKKLERLLYEEIKIQSYLQHSNIIKLYGVLNDEKKIGLILEAGESDLFRAKQKVQLTSQQIVKYIWQICNALSYIHKCGIVHRDLKLENVQLLFEEIKLADFGLAKKMPLEGYLSEYCGTVGYMAPEIIAKQPYNFKVDSYSLGILIYELETNKMPVFNGQQMVSEPLSNSDEQDLVLKLLESNQSQRISIFAALNHPWFLTRQSNSRVNFNFSI